MQFLNIIWKRIKEEHKTVLINHQKSLELTSKFDKLSEEEDHELASTNRQMLNALTILECDTEAFILFTRRFLDKFAKFVVWFYCALTVLSSMAIERTYLGRSKTTNRDINNEFRSK